MAVADALLLILIGRNRSAIIILIIHSQMKKFQTSSPGLTALSILIYQSQNPLSLKIRRRGSTIQKSFQTPSLETFGLFILVIMMPVPVLVNTSHLQGKSVHSGSPPQAMRMVNYVSGLNCPAHQLPGLSAIILQTHRALEAAALNDLEKESTILMLSTELVAIAFYSVDPIL